MAMIIRMTIFVLYQANNKDGWMDGPLIAEARAALKALFQKGFDGGK